VQAFQRHKNFRYKNFGRRLFSCRNLLAADIFPVYSLWCQPRRIMNDAVTEMDFDRDGYPALCSGKATCIEKALQLAILPDSRCDP
jgi:hypothetical protein